MSINIFTDSGRMCHPIYYLEDGETVSINNAEYS